MHVKSESCIVLFDLLLQQLYGILGQPSYNLYLKAKIRKIMYTPVNLSFTI